MSYSSISPPLSVMSSGSSSHSSSGRSSNNNRDNTSVKNVRYSHQYPFGNHMNSTSIYNMYFSNGNSMHQSPSLRYAQQQGPSSSPSPSSYYQHSRFNGNTRNNRPHYGNNMGNGGGSGGGGGGGKKPWNSYRNNRKSAPSNLNEKQTTNDENVETNAKLNNNTNNTSSNNNNPDTKMPSQKNEESVGRHLTENNSSLNSISTNTENGNKINAADLPSAKNPLPDEPSQPIKTDANINKTALNNCDKFAHKFGGKIYMPSKAYTPNRSENASPLPSPKSLSPMSLSSLEDLTKYTSTNVVNNNVKAAPSLSNANTERNTNNTNYTFHHTPSTPNTQSYIRENNYMLSSLLLNYSHLPTSNLLNEDVYISMNNIGAAAGNSIAGINIDNSALTMNYYNAYQNMILYDKAYYQPNYRYQDYSKDVRVFHNHNHNSNNNSNTNQRSQSIGVPGIPTKRT